MARLVFLSLMAMVCACSQPGGAVFEMAFWAGADARSDPRVIDVYEHCCCSGDVAFARIARMPAAEDPALEAELVVELSPSGEVVRRWSIPVDSIVAAVSDSLLIVPCRGALPEARAFAISFTGGISMTAVPTNAVDGTPSECPPLAEFGKSAYLRCFEFQDLATGRLRRIAYQGPCT